MSSMELAEAINELMESFDPYEYRDSIENPETNIQEISSDISDGNKVKYEKILKDIAINDEDLSVKAGVLLERLKSYNSERTDLEKVVPVKEQKKEQVTAVVLDEKVLTESVEKCGEKLSIHERLRRNKEKLEKKQLECLQKKNSELGR